MSEKLKAPKKKAASRTTRAPRIPVGGKRAASSVKLPVVRMTAIVRPKESDVVNVPLKARTHAAAVTEVCDHIAADGLKADVTGASVQIVAIVDEFVLEVEKTVKGVRI